MLKAKAKTIKGNKNITGYYVCLHKTSLCSAFFNGSEKEWEKIQKDNEKHYIVVDETTDWNMPNNHLLVEVDGDTVCMCSNMRDIKNKYIYENDRVYISFWDKFGVVKFIDGCFDVVFENGQRDYLKVYTANHDIRIIDDDL